MTVMNNNINRQSIERIREQAENNINRITTIGNIVVTNTTPLSFLEINLFSNILGKKYNKKNPNHFIQV